MIAFEKMNRRVVQREKHRPAINSNVKNIVITTRRNSVVPTAHKNTTDRINATSVTSFARTLNAISPYWFFTIGFLLGSACGIFTCYVWLVRKALCSRVYRARRRSDAQRVSLLQNLWQLEDPAVNESGTTSCPGTPPPPYREVMLRPGLYRNPSVTTNLNNNAIASSAGYT